MPPQTDGNMPLADGRRAGAEAHVEALVKRNRLDRGVDVPGLEPAAVRSVGIAVRSVGIAVRSVGIVGAGLMGTAIAAANVKHGLAVVLSDTSQEALARAPERIASELAQQTDGGRSDAPETVVDRLVRLSPRPEVVAECDLVLESVAEALPTKQRVLAELEPRLRAEAVLATNTSTIPISKLAEGLRQPGRLCGIHFFHPVRHRSLVEIIRGPETVDETIAAAVGYAKTIDKMPIVVADGPGFLVNRLLQPYLQEALEMLLDGAAIDEIDRAATDFGMAMGPLRIIDEIGLDTVILAGRVLWEAFPERIVASPLLITMYKQGRLGRKSGRGFFRYDRQTLWDGPGEPDPAVQSIIDHWARPPQRFDPQTIADRLVLPMVLEGTRLLEEGKVRDPRDVDLAVLFGLGFPAARGGLLFWADTLGARRIVEVLKPMESLGARARPTPMLLEMAQSGRRFYP